ncbi:MAG: CPBP family intramembrane metalloprotease [Candidatus Korarchaeota archaeon]|nr:CPBP family intramembrane metalloprotease [Candidatus Korarchaeota archaeon]
MREHKDDSWERRALSFLLAATVLMMLVPTPYLRALLSLTIFALLVKYHGGDPKIGTLKGSVTASILAFAMTLPLLPFSQLEFSGFDPALLLNVIPFHLSVAVWEEVVYRGYPLLRFSRTSLLASSLAFSLIHAFNPGFGLQAFLGVFVAGLALGLMRCEWGLGPAISMHFSWNIFMEHLWGYPTSGLRGPSVFVSKLVGSDILTGGDFGPEASIIVMAEFFSLFLAFRSIWQRDHLP